MKAVRVVAGALVCSAVAVSCSSASSSESTSTTTAARRRATSTVVSESSSTTSIARGSSTTASPESTSTTAVAVIGVGGCALPPTASDTVFTGTVTGDVNGDGALDTIRSWVRANDGGFRVLFGGGGGFETVVDKVSGSAATSLEVIGVVGLADTAADDTTNQVLARVGAGASAQMLGVFFYESCALRPVVLPDGQRGEFPIGATVTHADGVRCDGVAGGVVFAVQSATTNDGTHFTTKVQGYRYAQGRFHEYGAPIAGSMQLPGDAAALASFGQLDCGGITL